jgi:CRP-like cAMP-binding protein
MQEGSRVACVYLVVTGLLKLVYTDAAGKQHILSFALEDWWESDFNAFHRQTNATLSLECLEDTTVLRLTLDDYRQLCATQPKMAYFFLHKATFGHLGAQQRIVSLLTSNAQERYDQVVRQFPSLLQRVPKTVLATYLGVSRETLSRFSA